MSRLALFRRARQSWPKTYRLPAAPKVVASRVAVSAFPGDRSAQPNKFTQFPLWEEQDSLIESPRKTFGLSLSLHTKLIHK
jgi:hypothetical protein